MTTIVQTGDKVLRETAKEIALAEIKTPKIKGLLEKMKKALSAAADGVALAAPQVGASLQIFIVYKIYTDPKIMKKMIEKEKTTGKKLSPAEFGFDVFINPKILKISKKKQAVKEGCLSVIGVFGTMARAEKVTLEAYNEKGEKFTRGASDLLAQIFQHEMDHLNGVLFTDTAENLEKLEVK